MKLSKAQKLRLGTFVVTASTIFLGLSLLLAGLKVWEKRDHYHTRFTESVSGLEVSAPVKYRGLRVGNVDGMQISKEDPLAIEVSMALEPGTTLHKGTLAVLDMGGLTGLKSINLIPGDPKASALEQGAYIEAGPSLMHRLTGQAEQIAIKIEMVANELALWTRPENRMRVEKLIDNVTSLTANADTFIGDNKAGFQNTVAEIGRASASVVRVAGETERSLEQAREEAIITLKQAQLTIQEARRPLKAIDPKEVAKTLELAQQAVINMDRRLSNDELGKVVDDLLVSLKHLTQLIENIDLAVRAGREDFVSTLSNLEDATEDIREFSRIIAQDPSTLIMSKE